MATATQLKKSDLKITKALQDTVKSRKQINEVYFDEKGNFYFVKHSIKLHTVDDSNHTTKIEDVDCLPGAKLGIIMIKVPKNGGVEWKPAKRNIECEPIAATLTRDEILKATPVMDNKTEAEELEILKQAAEISKKGNFDELMKKLNKMN